MNDSLAKRTHRRAMSVVLEELRKATNAMVWYTTEFSFHHASERWNMNDGSVISYRKDDPNIISPLRASLGLGSGVGVDFVWSIHEDWDHPSDTERIYQTPSHDRRRDRGEWINEFWSPIMPRSE